jgi:hypothetical protein
VIPILTPEPVVYVCDRCPERARIPSADHRVPMHNCRGRALMSVPMIREGERADVRLVPRGDYVNGDDVRADQEGRVFMRSEVEHPDGHVDVFVYAPTAYSVASAEGGSSGNNGRGESRRA